MPRFALLVLALLALAGCNTMRGVGQDMSVAGQQLSDTATQAEKNM